MNLVLPFVSFIIGLFLAQRSTSEFFKPLLATLLARIFIPIVIIYNMVFYQAGSLTLMLFSFVSAVFLYIASMALFKDRLSALCFSYVNMAWLGFPFAIAIFGSQVSQTIVALYIGGSIFGNIWAVTAVSSEPQSKLAILKKVIQSPPFVALILAGLLRWVGLQHTHHIQWLNVLYSASKVGMTFAGMCILGMWLRTTKVDWVDIKQSTHYLAIKLVFGVLICGLAYIYLPIATVQRNLGVMFLLFCLPPAANIVALETHYQGTGRSARYIASGTIVSCVIIAIYALLLHLFIPSYLA